VAREPHNCAVRIELGHALILAGRLLDAKSCFNQVLAADPGNADALLGLGGVFEDQGQRHSAEAVYGEILQRFPGHPAAVACLLNVASEKSLEPALTIASDAMLHADDRAKARIGYALGKAYDRVGEYGAAFIAWSEANTARRREAGVFDRERFDARVKKLVEVFPDTFFSDRAGWGAESELPILVVGLPRSGTTLTERVLDGHPQIVGAGELPDWADLASATPDRLGREEPPWPAAATELNAEHVSAVGQDYLRRLEARLEPGERSVVNRVIDKQPLNFWYLGLVAVALPRARVLHCTRDLRDNGLSIYAEDFSPEQRWATDLSDIRHYWRGYRYLMKHWERVLGPRLLEVSYEDTVDDLGGQAEKLLRFLDVRWDPAVLSFHGRRAPVQTPSRWQVRQPIYKSSAGRWRSYEPFIGPLLRDSRGAAA